MSNGKQRIYEKVYSNFYEYAKKLGLIKPNNDSNNDSNNSNNNSKMDIIIPGHYQTKASLNSEKPDIIRVLGPDLKREDYWLTQDGKSIPGYALSEDFILLDTAPSESFKPKRPPQSIFAGLGEASEINNKIADDDIFQEIDTAQIKPAHKNELVSKPIEIKIQEENPKEKLILDILAKLDIDALNQKYYEKYQVTKYKKPVLNFQIPVELNFEIEKLKNAIELLDIDKSDLIDVLVNQVMDEIELSLLDDLKSRLSDLVFGNLEPDTFAEQKIKFENKIVETEIAGKINLPEKISSLYLSTIQKTIPVNLPNGNTVIGETIINSDNSISIIVKLPKNEFNFLNSDLKQPILVSSRAFNPKEEKIEENQITKNNNTSSNTLANDLLDGIIELRNFVDKLETNKNK